MSLKYSEHRNNHTLQNPENPPEHDSEIDIQKDLIESENELLKAKEIIRNLIQDIELFEIYETDLTEIKKFVGVE